jgi:cyclopropane-fatty-acyl-phospholipid synthase
MRKGQSTPVYQSSTTSPHDISGITGNRHVTSLDRWLTRNLLDIIGNPPVSFRLWNGEEISPAGINPASTLRINSRKTLFKLIIDPEFNFGELYCAGDIEVDGELSRFLQKVYPSVHYKQKAITSKLYEYLNHRRSHNNTLIRTRKNIYHHYDIGNEFYKQWLDREAMQYTCAYFPDPALTLEQAQVAKMHHVCRKLLLEPGQTVVEAGCGWGGLALFMAKEYGVKVKAYNISHEQVVYAKERAQQAGLTGQVEFMEDDYHNIQGRFDRFVSIGMLEHIGINHYRELGNIIDHSLDDNGFGLVHTIGRNQPCLLNAWIEAKIFPGACPPSLSQMMEIFEPYKFSVLDIENLRLHYAKTLQHWLDRFDANIDTFRKTYDDVFIRTWRLYLAGSLAAFQSGTMQLFQVVFTRPENNHLRWSRSHLYQPDIQIR